MEQTGKMRAEPHYYSDKLKRKLDTLRLAAAAVVEAPSGFGKTTAIRDYLEGNLPQSTPVYWLTATDEEPAACFKRLCCEIDRIDAKAGSRILKAEYPDPAAAGENCDALRSLQCKNETWLVIDNFQYLIDILPFSFICSLLTHGGERLHIVVLTQVIRREILAFMRRHGVAHITQAELCLSSDDIRRYYAAVGLTITLEDAAYLEHETGGWIAAVYLQLCAFRERGTFLDTAGILTIMEQHVYNVLSDTQQTFLLRLSPFGTVTMQQASALNGWETLPDDALEALQSPFIRFEPAERRYELHSILSDLLRKIRRERGAAFDRECLLRAGDLCREEGKAVRAMSFYAQIGDFERMLSLDLSGFYFETIGGVPFYELARKLAQGCPRELMLSRPLSMLRAAFALLTAGQDTDFRTLLEALRFILSEESSAESAYLSADWLLLSSFRHFPDVGEMTGVLKQASLLFNGRRSRVIGPESPWCYGVYSPLSVFHRTPGAAEEEAKALEEYYTLYARLTGGHGSGADTLFRTELARYRCALDEAEILAYKTIFIAQNRKQHLIQVAATFHLAEIVMSKGDSAGWRHTVAFLQQSVPGVLERSFVLPSAVDTVREIMLSDLGIVEACAADWLREGEFSSPQLADMESHRMMMHLGELQLRKKFARLVGTTEAAYPDGLKVARFADVHLALLAAAGYLGLHQREKAAALVRRAAAMTLPDGLFLQLIFYAPLLDGLVTECVEKDYPALLGPFADAAIRSHDSLASIHPEYFADELPESLTEREREVAQLAAEGLNNSEIARKLYLTVSTVRTHLRAVFKKLNIDRRARLYEKLR
jgi:LuxR family maltose regulon positive regulatory protein